MRAADLPNIYNNMPVRYSELQNRVALVTGASRGIGLGIAARLSREGMKVVLTGLEADEVSDVTKHFNALGAVCTGIAGDLAEDDFTGGLIERVLQTYGRLDLLVNNAADIRRARALNLPPQWIDHQWTVNVRAPMLLSLQAANHMGVDSSIVNISSVGGSRAQLPGLPYGVTKGALDAFTRNLAMDLGERNIRVNAVAPGWTPMNLDLELDAAYLRETSQFVSLRKACTPQDIGAAVAFLASADASYITGQILYVDGGLSMQLHPPEQPI